MTDGLGLGGAYGATLSRIKGQGGRKSKLGMATLMWVSHSERPLGAAELCHALAVEIGSPNLNGDNVPTIGTLLACCQGLVAIDKEASTVRLIHFTLQEYLGAHPELFGSAHSTMAETCLSYLNSQQVRALSTSPSPNHQNTPFLEYCSLYWGAHAKRDLSVCARLLALKLFDDFNNHASIKILLKAQNSLAFCHIDFDKFPVFNGLHCASIFGIDEIVAGLVEIGGYNINQRDCMGSTPLVWAAMYGHEGAAKILLGCGDISPNEPDEDDQAPLLWAARNGHEGVVKILLGQDDIDPDKPDKSGRTPLWWAANSGHEGVVKMLLGRDDVNSDRLDENDQTPLFLAAWNGYEGMARLLLERDDVSPDRPDTYGQTPLFLAAFGGHGGVVKLLPGRDVDPDRPGTSGQTPLWWATFNRHVGVMALLQPPASTTHSTT